MKRQPIYRFDMAIVIFVLLLVSAGCGNIPATASEPAASASPAPVVAASPSPESVATSSAQVPVSGTNALYQDNFTDPATGWPEDKFDNYFIGYHEPEYYHVEITGTHYKTTVFEPKKTSFEDFTVELAVLTAAAKTSPVGDFRYGLAFRRSGDLYYAFAISPRTKEWFVLKSTPNQLEVLAQGSDDSLHDADVDDSLRVDAKGSDFYFHINDKLVDQISDADYAAGEIGFYVESLDSPNTHIHFDTLTVRNFEAPEPQGSQAATLYEDNFTNPASNWPEKKFDNYFIGYHEPEYYHVEITGPNYKTTVFEPGKHTYDNFTAELDVLTAAAKTAPEGDFRYGLAFRRSGDQYYAFTISPRTKRWFVLKSSPSGISVLSEGTDEGMHDADVDDTLRVDAQGPNFLLHINDQLVGEITDADYTTGEIGFYVESLDSPNTHIHFDKLTVRDFEVSLLCDVNTSVTINMRSGPSTTFPSSSFLSAGAKLQPVGRNPNGEWLKIKVDGSDEQGWVFYSPTFMTCNADVNLLPVVNP
jgi:hypothetical protein